MDNISKEDGELYLRYKAAGLVACGKTNMPEFGLQPTTEPEAFGPNAAETPATIVCESVR